MMYSQQVLQRSLILLASISLAAAGWNQGTNGNNGNTGSWNQGTNGNNGNTGSWNQGGGNTGGGNTGGGNTGGWNAGSWSPGTSGPGVATPAPPQNTNQPIPSVVPGDGCAFAGQFLPVPGNQCTYYVCVVGGPSDPWADGSNRYTLARQTVPCAPGSGVPAGYTGGNSNPCEARPGACVPPKPAATQTPGGTNGGGGGGGGGGGSWSAATPAPSWQAPAWQAPPSSQYVVQIAPQRVARSPYSNQNAQQKLLQAWGNMQTSMKHLFSQLGKKK